MSSNACEKIGVDIGDSKDICQQRPRLFFESLLCQPNAVGFSFSSICFMVTRWLPYLWASHPHSAFKGKKRGKKKVCIYQEDTVPPKLPSRLLFHRQEFKHMIALSFQSKLASDKGWYNYILGLDRSLFISSDWIHWCLKNQRFC